MYIHVPRVELGRLVSRLFGDIICKLGRTNLSIIEYRQSTIRISKQLQLFYLQVPFKPSVMEYLTSV